MTVKKNYSLKKFTTIKIGGLAKYFVNVQNERELAEGLEFARQKRLPWYVLGEGSNIIAGDRGYKGVIIENKIEKFQNSPRPSLPKRGVGGEFKVTVGAGNNLLELISKLNRLGLAGLERMAGIPGTVGGAIYGCAGAYGQEIKDHLVQVRIFDGQKFKIFTNKQCRFGYRTSIFKKRKNWVITEAVFKLKSGKAPKLAKISRDTIELRKIKYKPGLKCPGSFFKNVKLADLPRLARTKLLRLIPKSKIMYGKIPAGYLLEEIGAKGMRQGSIRVADHHANLIYNPNGGRARDVKILARRLRTLVKNKFGVIIDEEIQYLPR